MIDQTSTARTMVESILQASWRMPLWLILVLALSCAAFVLWLYTSERGRAGKPVRLLLAAVRFTLLMTVLWMLAGWSWLRFESDRPELVIVLDRSGSMGTRDVGDADDVAKLTRLERSRELFEQLGRRERQQLAGQYQLQLYTVAEALELIAMDGSFESVFLPGVTADGTQSRLGDGLVRLIERQAGRGTAAIVFVSDGINTSGAALSDAAKAARRAAIPIHAVAVGRQYELPDLRLVDLLMEREVYLGDQVTVEVSVVSSDIPAAETRIVLRDLGTDKVLDETRLTVSSQKRQASVRLGFVPDRPGDISLRIEASSIPGEVELENNSLDAMVRVQDKTIRVLLVSDVASYEFRFLKSFLQRAKQAGETASSSFELHTVLQDADPSFADQDESALRLVPSRPEKISEYDVFVLIEFDPQLVSLSSQQAIYDSVTQLGAGCIFICGSGSPVGRLEGWPLAKLLPVERSDQRTLTNRFPLGSLSWQPTPLGSTALPMQLAHSIPESLSIWQRLPDFASICQIEQVKAAAQVLSIATDRDSGETAPLLITQFAGAGRTALQATDETYRWTTFSGTDLYYQRYWAQMLRWLSRGKLSENRRSAELLIDPKQASFGQPIRFQVTLGSEVTRGIDSEGVELAVEGSDGRREILKLTRLDQASSIFQASQSEFMPGTYRAVLVQPLMESPPSEGFTVTAPPGEQASLRANIEGMQLLAEQSRGRFYLEADAGRVLDELPPGKPTRLGALPSIPLWNNPWVALFFILLLTLEWILRRTYQML